jgi:hypothetical protein
MENEYFVYVSISNYIYIGLVLAACVIGVINWLKLNAALKVLVVFLLVTLASELLSILTENNSLIYTVYTPLHFLLLSLIFLLWLRGRIKYVIIASALLFCAIYFIYVNVKKADRSPYELIVIDAFLLVIFSIAGYNQLLLEPAGASFLKSSRFWFFSSIIIFFCGSFVLWISYPFLLNQPLSFTIKFYFLGWTLNMIQYSLMAKALLLKHNSER